MADEAAMDTQPPEVEEATGIALVGGYPVNHRLRAEAMAREGVDHDPSDLITGDLIAATRDRLAAEEAGEDAIVRADRALDRMSEAKLRKVADDEGVPVEGDADKATIRDAIRAKRATVAPPTSTDQEG